MEARDFLDKKIIQSVLYGNIKRNNGNDYFVTQKFMYLVWLALLGGNGFGGWNRSGDPAVQGALTRSDMFEGFNNQDVNGQLRGITNGLCDGFYTMNDAIRTQTAQLGSAIAENRFTTQQAACSLNRNIDDIKAEAYKNTCAITNAIHGEGEMTRALITQGTVQELRDKLEAKDRDLMSAQFQLSQQAQTAAIINQLQPVSKPAYITCSPYASASNACGYTIG